MGELVNLVKKVNAITNTFSDKEGEVFDTIVEYLDTLPQGFFAEHSLEELNKHFGGHDDMVVTEKVRKALDAQQKCEAFMDDMLDGYDDLPETDEDDDIDEDEEEEEE